MFLLSIPPQILLGLTDSSPSPQNLRDFTAYESPSNLQSTSTCVGVTAGVGCSIILNAAEGLNFSPPNRVDLNRSLQHRQKQNLPYRKSEHNY